MIGRIETKVRRARRLLSRSEWLARLLRLPLSDGATTRRGLVMIQIDGLAQPQLENAIDAGRMPFLSRLITREHYRIHAHYSGLPATTPAVQAELFYGTETAVPAFCFVDRETQRLVRMLEPEVAARVEQRLADTGGEPLLRGGSVYADCYTGGAAEAHFCPASFGWGKLLRAARPFALVVMLITNFYSLVRVGVLMIVELVIAVIDFMRGLYRGKNLAKELIFIPLRVAICILLRELVVIGTKIDVARGVPIIHLNLIGYDEQAHHRGPESRFAHWALKGIDDSVARIWRAATLSMRRHYDVWIYSDHGQETVRPYASLHGRSIKAAVAAVFEQPHDGSDKSQVDLSEGIQAQRSILLGAMVPPQLRSATGVDADETLPDSGLTVVASGPVGFVYTTRTLTREMRDSIGRALAVEAKVPLVIAADGDGTLTSWAKSDTFKLPEQRAEILGANHPFIDEIGTNLVALCEHPCAGDFVLFGWRHGVVPVSFANENGGHAGFNPVETNGFALLPKDTVLPASGRTHLRPNDLRRAALHFLHRQEIAIGDRRQPWPEREPGTLRVMTYNVHGCLGMDGKLSPERIARMIALADPDVVALQELDVGRRRSGAIDQARMIAQYLAMDFHFHPTVQMEDERYGDAILTHLPMRLVKAGPLPGLSSMPRLEPRGALWVTIEVCGTTVQLINTHLGLVHRERLRQVEALLGDEWLGHGDCQGPTILCGDFNAGPWSKVCRRLTRSLKDAQAEAVMHQPRATFSGRLPVARIDHVFASSQLRVLNVQVPRSEWCRVASDHLPLIVDFRVRS
jgi:endonuclease/exonuclease/phosphatase family metal-dependent hydrolase